MRKDARETVFKLLFADTFGDGLEKDFIARTINDAKLNENDATFAK